MIKKNILFLILAMIVMGGISAQDKVWNTSFKFDSGPTPHKGALFIDTSYTLAYLLPPPGFGIGLGWEGRINDFSTYLISGNIGIYGEDYHDNWYGRTSYSAFDFGIEGNYRYYFFRSALDKLFINGGLGYGLKTKKYTYERNREDTLYVWSVLNFPVYAGYKVIIGPGFAVEAHGGYRIGIEVAKPGDYPSGLSAPRFGEAIFGVAVGWAFK